MKPFSGYDRFIAGLGWILLAFVTPPESADPAVYQVLDVLMSVTSVVVAIVFWGGWPWRQDRR